MCNVLGSVSSFLSELIHIDYESKQLIPVAIRTGTEKKKGEGGVTSESARRLLSLSGQENFLSHWEDFGEVG